MPPPKVLSDPSPALVSSDAVRSAVGEALGASERAVAAVDLRTALGVTAVIAADATFVVVALGHTSISTLSTAIVDLKQAGVSPTGIVVT